MKKYLRWGVGVLLVGLISGMGYFVFDLNKQKDNLQVKYDQASQKNQLLLQKVKEEKSKISAMMHKNRATEAQQSNLRNEITTLEEKYSGLEANNLRLQNKLIAQEKANILEKKRLEKKYGDLVNIKKQCDTNYSDALAVMEQKKKEIKQHERSISSLEAKLKRTNIKLTKCEEKNSGLCDLSTSLLDKFENQGVFGNILKNENFIQLKRVEIEKMVQDYQDKIEDLSLNTVY